MRNKEEANKLAIVQLMHPGPEPTCAHKRELEWNTGTHKRKFLVSEAHYVANNKLMSGMVGFWGEWEPPSIIGNFEENSEDEPKNWHKPQQAKFRLGKNHQNTDPFVFSSPMYYTICRQLTKRGPLNLQRLAPGSLILFGSRVSGNFVLDTVFVVESSLWHSRNNRFIPPSTPSGNAFSEATLKPIYSDYQQCKADMDLRLYSGATHQSETNDIFSFFPCKPFNERKGFSRPTILLPKKLFGNKKPIRYSIGYTNEPLEIVKYWRTLVQQLTEQGFFLGIDAKAPLNIKKERL